MCVDMFDHDKSGEISWKEFGSTHGADEREILANLPAKMKTLGVDAVISGMGC